MAAGDVAIWAAETAAAPNELAEAATMAEPTEQMAAAETVAAPNQLAEAETMAEPTEQMPMEQTEQMPTEQTEQQAAAASLGPRPPSYPPPVFSVQAKARPEWARMGLPPPPRVQAKARPEWARMGLPPPPSHPDFGKRSRRG